ncbi:MAG: hypothetical protein IJC50_04690 [Clostridia bacterium]|nr:hypothetical protein [Clostridia bacterium]
MRIGKFKKLLAVAFCLMLTSCTNTENGACSSDLVSLAVTECESLKGSYTVYISTATEGQDGYLCPVDFYSLYYTEAGHANELDLLDDWCIALSASGKPRELHILKLKSKSERPKIEEMLRRRQKKLISPELYRPQSEFLYQKPDDAEVFFYGNFVILCSSDNVEEAIRMFK